MPSVSIYLSMLSFQVNLIHLSLSSTSSPPPLLQTESAEEKDAPPSQSPPSSKVISNDNGKPVLEHLDIRIEPGQFVCIVGSVGSGKSTLLAGLLNECRTKGVLACGGIQGLKDSKIGYCPQQVQKFVYRLCVY